MIPNKSVLAVILSVVIGLSGTASTTLAQKGDENAGKADPNIVVVMRGLGTPVFEPRQPDASCLRGDLYDLATDRLIGTAVDCFDGILPAPPGEGSGFYLDRTTYFAFPQGELVARGVTTVQPVLAGSPGSTHLTGDVPEEGANSIISGTKRFASVSGRVRLSGAATLLANGDTIFNCIFVIDLD